MGVVADVRRGRAHGAGSRPLSLPVNAHRQHRLEIDTVDQPGGAPLANSRIPTPPGRRCPCRQIRRISIDSSRVDTKAV